MGADDFRANLASIDFDNYKLVNMAMCPHSVGNLTFFLNPGQTKVGSLSREVACMGNPACAIEEISVPCTTGPTLLKQEGLDASGVDMLHVDVEGLETMVVNQFLGLDGFEPTILEFLWHRAPN